MRHSDNHTVEFSNFESAFPHISIQPNLPEAIPSGCQVETHISEVSEHFIILPLRLAHVHLDSTRTVEGIKLKELPPTTGPCSCLNQRQASRFIDPAARLCGYQRLMRPDEVGQVVRPTGPSLVIGGQDGPQLRLLLISICDCLCKECTCRSSGDKKSRVQAPANLRTLET